MFPFTTALNASTLFPFGLDITRQIEVAATAGFQGIEVWIKDLDAYTANGGTMRALRQHVADSGLNVVNGIAFFAWADTDDATQRDALDQAEREMTMLAELGCPAVAAPPFGNVAATTLDAMGTAFAALVDRTSTTGVVPYLEFWGRATRLSRLSDALQVASASGLSDVKFLLDPFHMYTGGTDTAELASLDGASVGIVHVNDYPATPPRSEISDAERIFPGEGTAPTHELARHLHAIGYRGALSLELFRPSYGNMSAVEVARYGLAAMQAAYTIDE